MSNQLMCDSCLKPIDQTEPYVTVSTTQVKLQATEEGSPAPGGGLEVVVPSKTYDYHSEHAPKFEPDDSNVAI